MQRGRLNPNWAGELAWQWEPSVPSQLPERQAAGYVAMMVEGRRPTREAGKATDSSAHQARAVSQRRRAALGARKVGRWQLLEAGK
jgi:hypothetical protein